MMDEVLVNDTAYDAQEAEAAIEPEAEAEAAELQLPEAEEEKSDYARIVEDDLAALRAEFSELSDIGSILELKNPVRYGALRDLGLTPAEAYLATEGRALRRDNRSHLKSSVPPRAAQLTDNIPKRELEIARELFSDLSDKEIHKLYKRVKG